MDIKTSFSESFNNSLRKIWSPSGEVRITINIVFYSQCSCRWTCYQHLYTIKQEYLFGLKLKRDVVTEGTRSF
jgi:hypothetical protein